MHRYTPALLSFLAESFFFSPVISSLRAVNFGSGRSNRRIKSRTKVKVVATGLAALYLMAGTLFAQNVWRGGNSPFPTNWFFFPNWLSFLVPTSGENVIINNSFFASTVVAQPGAVAAEVTVSNNSTPLLPGPGSLTIESTGTLTVGSNLNVGIVAPYSSGGSLTVANVLSVGGALTPTLGSVAVGSTLNVSSGGSVAAGSLAVGTKGETGTVNISSGGSVSVTGFEDEGIVTIGNVDGQATAAGGKGIVNVTGGSLTTKQSGIVVGAGNGTGTLNITDGGTVSSATNIIIGNGVPGAGLQGTGTVLVNGGTLSAGTTVSTSGVVSVGQYGHGTLTVQDGGVVNAPGGIYVSTIGIAPLSASGVINIGSQPVLGQAPTALPGILNTPEVHLQNGGGPGLFGNPGTLNFNHTSTAYVFSPAILSTAPGFPNIGVVNQLAGTTILTANSGPANNGPSGPSIDGYGGGTNITGGTLAVGVPDSSDATVTAGSFALGVGNVSLTGGTLRTTSLLTGINDPVTGKPIVQGIALPINVGGNYTQGPGGTLLLGIGGTQGEQFDHVVVAKNATLDATLAVASLLNFHPSAGDEFEVLHTDGTVHGNFSVLNDSAFNTTPGVITGHLELRPIEIVTRNAVVLVYLAVPPAEEIPQPPPGGTEQPPIVNDPGITLPPVNPEEPLPESEVLPLVNPTAEELTSLYQIGFSAANMQRFNLGDRMFQIQQSVVPPPPVPPPPSLTKETEGKGVEGKAPVPAPPPSPTNRWGVWANSWGDFVNLDSTSAAQGYRFTTFGISAGVDYLIIPNHFAVGLFGGYSHSWINLTQSGSASANTGRGGLYATYFNHGWWVNVAAWGGGTNYSTSRAALAGTANGETSGWEVSTFGEAGYDFHWNDLSFGPTVAMQYTNVHLNGFGENGSLVPLDIHSDSQDSLVTDVGGRAYYKFHVGSIPVIPTIRLAWEHEYFVSSLPLTISAPALDNATTVVNGPYEGHDSLIINAGISVQWTPRIWTTIGYDGQVARDNYNSNAVTGTFSFSF